MIIVLFAAIACVYLAVCIDENRKRWKKIRKEIKKLKGD